MKKSFAWLLALMMLLSCTLALAEEPATKSESHILIAIPRHNEKVERQHRTDELRFYRHMRMFGLEDGRKQLAIYQRESNNHIMTCLGMKSPNQVLALYHGVMW